MSYARSVQKFRMNIWQQPGLPRILIEGDSWSEHPLVSNLSWSLHLYLQNKVNMLNISQSGDLIYNIAQGRQFSLLSSYLKTNMFDFDLLFLSGGGNDILVNSDKNYCLSKVIQSGTGDEVHSYINQKVWNKALKRITDSYRKILQAAEQINPSLLVHGHNYDYIYPRNNGADVIVIPDVIGPWVEPVMLHYGINDQMLMRRIANHMLDEFSAQLTLLKTEFCNFDFSNTLGTLPDLTSWGVNVPYWDDEIHPNSKGFAKLIEAKIGPDIIKRLNL